MRKLAMALLAGTLSLGGVGSALADPTSAKGSPETTEQEVTLADLPDSARATLEREAKGGRIEELTKETSKNGTVTYEAEIVKDGKGREVEVSEKGMLLERGKAHDESKETEKHDK
jgi:hypothetical protein